MAESGREHRVDLRRCPRHVVVDNRRGEYVRLQRDRTVPPFDEMTEDFVAQQRESLDPVGRLTEGEQRRRLRPCGEQFIEGAAEARRVVELAADGTR